MSTVRKLLRPLKRAFRRWVYRRWDLIIAVRDNRKPLYQIPRVAFDVNSVRIALAQAEDAPLFATPQWKHVHAKFVDRIHNQPGYGCLIGVLNGELISMGPYVVGKYFDRGMRHEFDPGPNGLYWFEGETAAAWRSRGVALIGMNWLFEQLEELTGCTQIMTYYRMDNRASRRLHERYFFEPQYRLIWRQLGPLRWSKKTPLPAGL